MIKHTIYTEGFNGPAIDSIIEFTRPDGLPYVKTFDNVADAMATAEAFKEQYEMNIATIYIAE